MASSVMSIAAVASINKATPTQASMLAPFNGLKSTTSFPTSRKTSDITTIASNGAKFSACRASFDIWGPCGNIENVSF
ncbi:hypothetical protein LIER_02423 [Lithospermum erythrorhizon]|uniref:Ribulose-1,5-bisphosphate carboxylase small subunit N-terminal domain-containing protein n=1 Tax=Lithospermum erythrorhizon TaxID=34254 RepID=A0AAV3NRW5_LITER